MKKWNLYWLAAFSVTMSFAQGPQPVVYDFPISRPHAGMIIGNGTQGLMIWGSGNVLNVSIGHNGFWDHRGYNALGAVENFEQVKTLLLNNDPAIAALVPIDNQHNPGLHRQLGGGNLEIRFPEGYRLKAGKLDLETAIAKISVLRPDGTEETVAIRQHIRDATDIQFAWIELPIVPNLDCTLQPSWDWVGNELEKAGIDPPRRWVTKEKVVGFTQSLPKDSSLNLFYRFERDFLLIGSLLGELNSVELDEEIKVAKIDQGRVATEEFWKKYWDDVPTVRLPDKTLQNIVEFGLYKQACVTPPHAKAAGLQGPFLEHYQLPPWGADFHFNINVEMVYESALASNRPGHLKPLWSMINSWLPALHERGQKMYGREKAIFLPTAMDDLGQMRARFSPGMIDQANTAWLANLAWRHYRYTKDEHILASTAWPLLIGAFEAYDAVLEKTIDGNGHDRYSLPVSVSPEYGGTTFERSWGRNASFQLAALHSVLRTLPKAAKILGHPVDPHWSIIAKGLPLYTTVDGVWQPENQQAGVRIALWEGQDLEGSHRHHSHLAGIYPFRTINPADSAHRRVLSNTLQNWIYKGAGNWMGWSLPWASTIWSRVGNADASVKWLHYWADNYVNEGGASLAFLHLPTVALSADRRISATQHEFPWERHFVSTAEKMQMDASMGALTAVFELLVQNIDNDVIDVLPHIPSGWKMFGFSNILAEGAFLVSAEVRNGETVKISIRSKRGGLLKLKHDMGRVVKVDGEVIRDAPQIITAPMEENEELVLERVSTSIAYKDDHVK